MSILFCQLCEKSCQLNRNISNRFYKC